MKRCILVVLVAACGSVSGDEKQDARSADSAPMTDGAMGDTPPAFSPSQLTGLVVWLDADKGVVASANKVSGWMDQSGAGNSAVQLTAARQPMQVANVLNGHAVLRFDGASNVMQIADAASMQWGTDDFTLAVVASWTNTSFGYGAILTKQIDGTYPYQGASIWANFPQPAESTKFGVQVDAQTAFASSGVESLNDGKARVLVGRRVGLTLEVRVSGVSDGMKTTAAAVDASAAGYVMHVGGHAQGDGVIQALQGDIAEVIAIHGVLVDADLQKLETYLKTKYGL